MLQNRNQMRTSYAKYAEKPSHPQLFLRKGSHFILNRISGNEKRAGSDTQRSVKKPGQGVPMKSKKIIPLDKQSKKNRKRYHAAQRGSWNGRNPVTRMPANPKAYNRVKEKQLIRRDGISE